MKRLITFLFVLLTLLWALPVYSQANRQQFCRVRDGTNPASLANVLQLTLNMPATTWGLSTKSGTYYYDTTGAAWRYWHGIQSATNLTALPRAPFTLGLTYFYSITSTDLELWSGNPHNVDTVAHGTEAPYVGSFTYGINRGGNQWARISGFSLGGTFAGTEVGLTTAGAGYYWHTGNALWTRWEGAQPNSDAIAVTAFTPYVSNFSHIYQTDTALWARDGGETADGGNIAATVDAAYRLTLNYGWNGTNWSPTLIGAVGEVQMADVTTRPGEDAGNDWRKVKKEETAVYNPAVTEGTAVTDASAIVCASTYVLNLPNWSVFVKNAGGGAADAFTDVDVQISYDGTEWSSETSTACDTLASGVSARCFKGANESAAYVQVIVDVAGGDTTTCDCVVIGNKN